MARMPDFSGDLGPVEGFAARHGADAVEDFMRKLMRPHHHDAPPQDAPQPAAEQPPIPPVPAVPATQEEPVSLQVISEIEDAVKAAAAKFEAIDHDALAMVDAIKASPLASEALSIIGALTGLPAADFTTALGVLRMTLAAAGGQPVQAADPNGTM